MWSACICDKYMNIRFLGVTLFNQFKEKDCLVVFSEYIKSVLFVHPFLCLTDHFVQ